MASSVNSCFRQEMLNVLMRKNKAPGIGQISRLEHVFCRQMETIVMQCGSDAATTLAVLSRFD
jgi:hypothetical protein